MRQRRATRRSTADELCGLFEPLGICNWRRVASRSCAVADGGVDSTATTATTATTAAAVQQWTATSTAMAASDSSSEDEGYDATE
jgi:hypothetical protein